MAAVAVQFHVTSDAPIDSYEWDFGDGTSHSTASDPYHLYADGTYRATVILTFTTGVIARGSTFISIDTVYDIVLEYVS